MILEELENKLAELIGDDFRIVEDGDGQIVIFSGLKANEMDGELETVICEDYTDEELDLTPLMNLKDIDF